MVCLVSQSRGGCDDTGQLEAIRTSTAQSASCRPLFICVRGGAVFGTERLCHEPAHLVLHLGLHSDAVNLVFGVAGIMNFGHAAVFAVGAYTTGMIATHTDPPFLLSFLLSAPAGLIFSLGLGLLTMRMRGEYVAIVTMAISILLYTVVVDDVDCYGNLHPNKYITTSPGKHEGSPTTVISNGLIIRFAHQSFGDYYVVLVRIDIGFGAGHSRDLRCRSFRIPRHWCDKVYARSRGVDFRKYQLIVFGFAGIVAASSGGVLCGASRPSDPVFWTLSFSSFCFL